MICFSTFSLFHYNDVIMGAIASQITSLPIVYSIVYSDADQRKHQSSASLAFVWGIHRGPVNSPHKWPVMRKMFPFDDVIMLTLPQAPYGELIMGYVINVIVKTLQMFNRESYTYPYIGPFLWWIRWSVYLIHTWQYIALHHVYKIFIDLY